MRWSDLEYVLAVASKGSVAAAARALEVNHTTVLRRVRAFESRHDMRIFEHRRSGYRPTPEGEVFLEAALEIEATVLDLDRKVAGGDPSLQGMLSITTTDSIFPVMAEDLVALQQAYPEIVVDVAMTNHRLDLDKRDADIAIRASISPPPHLVGRRVCDLRVGVYATPALAEAYEGTPLETRPWLGLKSPLTASVFGEWLAETIPNERIIVRSNSFIGLRNLAEVGTGHTLLPRHLGDVSEWLVRVEAPVENLATGVWLLSHRDVLRARRVRLGTDFLYEALKRKRGLFEGR